MMCDDTDKKSKAKVLKELITKMSELMGEDIRKRKAKPKEEAEDEVMAIEVSSIELPEKDEPQEDVEPSSDAEDVDISSISEEEKERILREHLKSKMPV